MDRYFIKNIIPNVILKLFNPLGVHIDTLNQIEFIQFRIWCFDNNLTGYYVTIPEFYSKYFTEESMNNKVTIIENGKVDNWNFFYKNSIFNGEVNLYSERLHYIKILRSKQLEYERQ